MLKLKRVCVPLTLDCNLHCKYCYRDKEKIDIIPEFTEDMKEYLRNLSSTWCEAVIASGGEPLTHWDKVQELFSYVPDTIHKKIMSNCVLLTQDIVDYINNKDIELSISHDGAKTKFLRGVDVLENKKKCDLIRQVKNLRVVSVVTRYNTDVWANFFDTAKKLQRIDFEYNGLPILDIPEQQDLIKDFDYDTWCRTLLEFTVSPYRYVLPWYKGKTISASERKKAYHTGFNVLPNGTICGMADICDVYGTIDDSFEDCYQQLLKTGRLDYCIQKNCKYADICNFGTACDTEHIYKFRSIILDFRTHPEKVKALRKYVWEHIEEIKEKYNFTSKDLSC